MSGVLLDTTFLVDVLRGDRPALDVMEELERGSARVLVPTVVLFELWEGIERSRAPIRDEAAIVDALASHTVLPMTLAHAQRAGKLSAELLARGASIGDADVLVAGVALAEEAVVVTRNARDFEAVPGLTVRSY